VQCPWRWYRAVTGPTPKTRAGPGQPAGLEVGPSTARSPRVTVPCRARIGPKCRAVGRAVVPQAAWPSIKYTNRLGTNSDDKSWVAELELGRRTKTSASRAWAHATRHYCKRQAAHLPQRWGRAVGLHVAGLGGFSPSPMVRESNLPSSIRKTFF
jgi:hypothetical protein